MINSIKKTFQTIKEGFKEKGFKWFNSFFSLFFVVILLKSMYDIFTHNDTFTTYFICIFLLLVEIYSKILDILGYIRKAHTILALLLKKVNEEENEVKVIKDEI